MTAPALRNVQALRAVAAYLVVAHHAREYLRHCIGVDLATPIGQAGVDVFFAISGLIMVVSTAEGSSARGFLARRAIRIVPIYWIATLAVFAVALFAPRWVGSTSARLDHLALSLLFVPFEKTPGQVMPVLFPGWTLNFEVLFYVLFGLTLLLRDSRRQRLALAGILVALGLGGWVLHPASVALRFFSSTIVLEFLGGAAIGWAYLRLRDRGAQLRIPGVLLLLAGIAGLVWAGVTTPDWFSVLDPSRPVRWGIPAALVVAGAVALDAGGIRIGDGLVVRQGDASYSIYLLHWFVIMFVVRIAGRWLPAGRPLLGAALLPLVFVAVGVAGWASYSLIERPSNRLLRRLLLAPRAAPERAAVTRVA